MSCSHGFVNPRRLPSESTDSQVSELFKVSKANIVSFLKTIATDLIVLDRTQIDVVPIVALVAAVGTIFFSTNMHQAEPSSQVQYPNRYILYTQLGQKNPCLGTSINKDLWLQPIEELVRHKIFVPTWLTSLPGPVLIDTYLDKAYEGPSLRFFLEAHAMKAKKQIVYDD